MKYVLKYGALGVALIYAVLSTLWIVFSDMVTAYLFENTPYYQLTQSIKGSVFIIISAFLLFVLVRTLSKLQHDYVHLVQHSERNYREIFSKNPIGQILFELESLKLIKLNIEAKSLLALKNEALSFELTDLFNDDQWKQLIAWRDTVVGSRSSIETLQLNIVGVGPKHRAVTLKFHMVIYDERPVGLITIADNTSMYRYIRSIEQASVRLEVARDLSGIGFWEIDICSDSIICCPKAIRLLGLKVAADEPRPVALIERASNLDVFSEIKNHFEQKSKNTNFKKEVRIARNNGGGLRYLLCDARMLEVDGQAKVIGTLFDVSPFKLASNQLLQREKQLQTIVSSIPEGIAIIQQGLVVYANTAAATMFRLESPKHFIGENVINFVAQCDIESVKQRMRDLMLGNPVTNGFMHRRLKHLNGEVFDAEIAANLVIYEGEPSIQLVVRDLTEPMKMKEALEASNKRLMLLSSQTLDLLERERKRIAGELHDSVGQSLTAIKLATAWVGRRLTDPLLKDKVMEIQGILGETLETVRNLSLMLRPSQLDNLGFAAAIEWQAEKLFSSTDVKVNVDSTSFKPIIDEDIEITAFRIVQESLTNIARHAQASTVDIFLSNDDKHIGITITDDGVGFDPNAATESTGLINMKERVELLHGSFDIRSLPGVGTEIKAVLPLSKVKDFESNIVGVD